MDDEEPESESAEKIHFKVFGFENDLDWSK